MRFSPPRTRSSEEGPLYVVAAELLGADVAEGRITVLVPGISIDIPAVSAFQYQNVMGVDLKFICIAM
jgi:mannose-6-phosphate isomerase-like protein (cupin superfamily)